MVLEPVGLDGLGIAVVATATTAAASAAATTLPATVRTAQLWSAAGRRSSFRTGRQQTAVRWASLGWSATIRQTAIGRAPFA